MTAEEISNKLSEEFGEKIVETDIESVQPSVTIDPSSIKEICKYLKNDPAMKFNSLMCLSGVDHDEENLRIVYNLDSLELRHKITLYVIVPKESPVVDTVSDVWNTADWHEREAYDLFGFTFNGHPDHRRILLPDDWEGFPLRKDYVVQETYGGLQIPYSLDKDENN